MRHCAQLTCCAAFGRTHRSWCSFVWLSISGMRLVGGFRRFDVAPLKQPRHLRCRSDPSRRKPKTAPAYSAAQKDEIQHEHNREQISKPADLASATAESLHDRVADKSKRQAIGNRIREGNASIRCNHSIQSAPC